MQITSMRSWSLCLPLRNRPSTNTGESSGLSTSLLHFSDAIFDILLLNYNINNNYLHDILYVVIVLDGFQGFSPTQALSIGATSIARKGTASLAPNKRDCRMTSSIATSYLVPETRRSSGCGHVEQQGNPTSSKHGRIGWTPASYGRHLIDWTFWALSRTDIFIFPTQHWSRIVQLSKVLICFCSQNICLRPSCQTFPHLLG